MVTNVLISLPLQMLYYTWAYPEHCWNVIHCQVIFIKVDSLLSAPKDERSVLHYVIKAPPRCIHSTLIYMSISCRSSLTTFDEKKKQYNQRLTIQHVAQVSHKVQVSRSKLRVVLYKRMSLANQQQRLKELKIRRLITGQEFPLKMQMSLNSSNLLDPSY